MYAYLKRHYLSLLSHFSTPADAFSIVVADRSNANQKFLVRLLSSPPCASHYVRACNFELDSQRQVVRLSSLVAAALTLLP
jgi:hypothetical protein